MIRQTGRTEVFALEVRVSGERGSNQGKCRPRGTRPFTWVFEFRTKSHKSGGPERIGLRRAISGRLRDEPVTRSAPRTPGDLPLSPAVDQAESTARMGTGGQGGIRTHETLSRLHTFQACAFDRSATCPAQGNLSNRRPVASASPPISRITRCPPTRRRSRPSCTTLLGTRSGRLGGAVKGAT